MFRHALTGLVLVLALALTGCGDSRDSVIKDSISDMKKLVDVLKGIKDEASAKSAADRIKAITENMKAIKARADKLGKPSPEEDKALQAKYETEMKSITTDMGREMLRITMDPALREPMMQAMEQLQEAMRK
jgi:hypothetical protein